MFYFDISSYVMNNGLTIGYFNVNRGLRQGDPITCYLFDIRGININQNVQIKMAFEYADDISCFVQDVASSKKIINTLEDFQICSSMKVNYDKTEAMWIAKSIFNKEKPLPLSWTDCVKILGVHLTYDDKVMNKLNFEDKLKSLKQLIALWKQRDLTHLGKIVIMKSFGFSNSCTSHQLFACPRQFKKDQYRGF